MPGTLTTTTTQTLQTTQTLLQQVGTQLQNQISSQQYNLGNFVTNVSILPYIPSATIQFDAYGLKPNTRLYAYFGNVPVSNWCAPRLPLYDTDSVAGLQQTSVLGTPLYSDSYGICKGIFRIPPNAFKSQEITFKLLDISDLAQGESAITTEADGVYYGSTLSVAKGQSLLNTRQTVVSSTQVKQQQSIDGLAVATEITQQYEEDPPVYYGGSGCGCGCFIGDTLVTMFDGSVKRIDEVKIGDKVYNRDKTKINTVQFVEKLSSSYFNNLYSPSAVIKPFATENHPIYFGDKLFSLNPDQNYKWYPWLGKNEKLSTENVEKTTGEMVYNLWLDGDGTYIVNGFGTNSIIGDGGILLRALQDNIVTEKEAMELLMKYLDKNVYVVHGAYIVSKFIGKLNWKWLTKVGMWFFKNDNIISKITDKLFGIFGFVSRPMMMINR